jgi:biopolymer transport protein ExbD
MRIAAPRRKSLPMTLVPLIDVVCVLLIFFMLATTFARWTALPLDLGGNASIAQATVPADGVGTVLIRVAADGVLDLNGVAVTLEDLDREVAAILVARPAQPFLVRPGEGTSLQTLVDLLERLKRLGVTSAALVGG